MFYGLVGGGFGRPPQQKRRPLGGGIPETVAVPAVRGQPSGVWPKRPRTYAAFRSPGDSSALRFVWRGALRSGTLATARATNSVRQPSPRWSNCCRQRQPSGASRGQQRRGNELDLELEQSPTCDRGLHRVGAWGERRRCRHPCLRADSHVRVRGRCCPRAMTVVATPRVCASGGAR